MRPFVFFTALGVVAVALLVFWYQRRPGVEADAKTILEAALSNDPDTIFEFSSPGERQGIPVTRESFHKMWKELVAPRLAKYKVAGPIEGETMAPGHEGVAKVPVVGPNGRRLYLGAMAFATEGRSQTEIVRQYLVQAWRLDYYATLDAPGSTEANLAAEIAGLNKDRSALLALGMKGTFWKPVAPIATWDAMMAQYDEQLRQHRAASAR